MVKYQHILKFLFALEKYTVDPVPVAALCKKVNSGLLLWDNNSVADSWVSCDIESSMSADFSQDMI
jgi:hypothetical protein